MQNQEIIGQIKISSSDEYLIQSNDLNSMNRGKSANPNKLSQKQNSKVAKTHKTLQNFPQLLTENNASSKQKASATIQHPSSHVPMIPKYPQTDQNVGNSQKQIDPSNNLKIQNIITQVSQTQSQNNNINLNQFKREINSSLGQTQENKNYQTNLSEQQNQQGSLQPKHQKSHSYSPNRLLNTKIDICGLLPPKTSDKKTLVLDLDETLVHSCFIPFQQPPDVIIKFELENEIHDIHVLVRPGVKEFLERMAKNYELVIFTASISKYADPLLDIIDKKGYCPFRFFREHCTLVNTTFVKDLKKLGRDLKDIIIVDNSPFAYALNQDNGLPILSWFEDKNDRELYHITPILEFLSYVPDVRDYIPKIVVDNEIDYARAMNVITEYNKNIMKKKKLIEKEQKEKMMKEKLEKERLEKEREKDTQQINIKIINNNITNYICNNNNNTEKNIENEKEKDDEDNLNNNNNSKAKNKNKSKKKKDISNMNTIKKNLNNHYDDPINYNTTNNACDNTEGTHHTNKSIEDVQDQPLTSKYKSNQNYINNFISSIIPNSPKGTTTSINMNQNKSKPSLKNNKNLNIKTAVYGINIKNKNIIKNNSQANIGKSKFGGDIKYYTSGNQINHNKINLIPRGNKIKNIDIVNPHSIRTTNNNKHLNYINNIEDDQIQAPNNQTPKYSTNTLSISSCISNANNSLRFVQHRKNNSLHSITSSNFHNNYLHNNKFLMTGYGTNTVKESTNVGLNVKNNGNGNVNKKKNTNLNINTTNQISIASIDFMKNSINRNTLKYPPSLNGNAKKYNLTSNNNNGNNYFLSLNSVNKKILPTSTSSNNNGNSNTNMIKTNSKNNFLKNNPSHEIIFINKNGNKQKNNNCLRNKPPSGHMKSLSYNFDVGTNRNLMVNNNSSKPLINIDNSMRPISSKKMIKYISNNDGDKKKNKVKDFRAEVNEILQKKSMAKSTRSNDLKGGFKYQPAINIIPTESLNIKFNNKKMKK